MFATHTKMAKLPNILITGTPGTGKTSTAEAIAERTGLKYVNTTKVSMSLSNYASTHLTRSVFQLIKDHECYEGVDSEYDTLILDEDKFCDVLEPIMEEGGVVRSLH